MKAANTKDKSEFIIDHLWWAFIAWIWYKNTLFRCFGSLSLKESRLLLLTLILSCSVPGIVLGMKNKRNSINVFMNLASGFGLYAVFTYLPIKRRFILVIVYLAVFLAETYTLLVLCRKIKNRTNIKKILVQRIIRACYGARNIISTGLALLIFTFGINTLLGTSFMKPSVAPAKQSNVEEQTIQNNMDTLVLLFEDTWRTLPVEDKLGVLQTVANIEQRYLGLPNELNVGAANLVEGLVGYYTDSSHEIIVSLDSLLNDSSFELVDTVAHEAYHSLQHRMVDAYDEASDEMKDLMLYYDASVYKEEFADYTDGTQDFCSYYAQECETDARLYARSAVYEYFKKIYEYLNIDVSENAAS